MTPWELDELRELNRRMTNSFRGYQPQEVIEKKKPRLRDYFNPMFYIRKELQKVTDILQRLEASVSALQTGVADLATKITEETKQHAAMIEELRGLATNPNMSAEQTARLSAIADSLDASVSGLNMAAAAVSQIVPDAKPTPPPAPDVDRAVALVINLSPQPAPIVAGTAFDFNVQPLDDKGGFAKDYAGSLHFSSDSTDVELPVDQAYNPLTHLTALFAAAGTYVLTVVDVNDPSITAGKLSVTVN